MNCPLTLDSVPQCPAPVPSPRCTSASPCRTRNRQAAVHYLREAAAAADGAQATRLRRQAARLLLSDAA